MGGLISDIKQGVRTFRQRPALVCYVLAIVGLGIGANTATFSVVSAALFDRIPWPNADRIVSIRETNPDKQIMDGPVSTADYLQWKDSADSFDLTSGFLFRYFNITGKDSPERVEGFAIDQNFLPIIGVKPLLGRNFTELDTEPGNDREAILTYRLWQRHFGGDPNIVGSNVTIEGKPYIIIGVMPSEFWMFKVLNHDVDLLVPLALDRPRLSHGSYDLNLYGRLKTGVTIQQAQTQLTSLYKDLDEKYPETNAGSSAHLVPLMEWNGPIRSGLLLLFTAVGFVLLIASANIANLFMAMAHSRAKELAIRQAIGAGRVRLARQLLTESLMLSIAGGAIGLLVAGICLDFLNEGIPYSVIRRVGNFQLDLRVLFFALAVCVMAGLAFGLAPAILSPRMDVSSALKNAGFRAGPSRAKKRTRELLVAVEVALTVVLLASSGIVTRSALHLYMLDRGLNSKNLLVMQIWLPEAKYPEKSQVSGFYERALQRIRLLPGVESAGLVDFPPLDIISPEVEFNLAGRASSLAAGNSPAESTERAVYRIVDPEYFRTLRIPLIEGRYFEDSDSNEAHGVAIINKSLAKSLWTTESPIGNSIVLHFPNGRDLYWIPESMNLPLTIVGVVGDIDKTGLAGARSTELYLPYLQNPSRFIHLIVRTKGRPLGLASMASDQIRDLDRDQPVFEIRTLEDVISRSFSQSRVSSLLLCSFAGLALVIAGLGVYGVVSATVAERESEIGIRVALGAAAPHIFRVMIGRTMLLTTVGILIGVLGTLAAARLLQSSLLGVVAGDRSTPLLVAFFAALVSLVAAYLPARKAMNVDPVQALKRD